MNTLKVDKGRYRPFCNKVNFQVIKSCCNEVYNVKKFNGELEHFTNTRTNTGKYEHAENSTKVGIYHVEMKLSLTGSLNNLSRYI